LVTNPSDSCFLEYPEYLDKDENGNCTVKGIADKPRKKRYYNCSDYPEIYLIGCVESSPK